MFRFGKHFQAAHFERGEKEARDRRDITTLRSTYQWQQPGSTKPPYPPCLKSIPKGDETALLQIFNLTRFIDTAIALLSSKYSMNSLEDYVFGDWKALTMAGLEANMAQLRRQHKNIGTEPSIANRPDWFTDAVFAQQSFTGPNPTSIKHATLVWITQFALTAKKQGNEKMYILLTTSDQESFYIQDYSYFRDAVGAFPNATLQSDDKKRFGCAAVTLFQLNKTGALHPLCIVIDYIISMDHSVVIFNARLKPTDPAKGERDDWPWRYAKMCHMVSDYYRHELEAHLNNCHFIEEATIVAAYRSFTSQHVVYKLLEPHWWVPLPSSLSSQIH